MADSPSLDDLEEKITNNNLEIYRLEQKMVDSRQAGYELYPETRPASC